MSLTRPEVEGIVNPLLPIAFPIATASGTVDAITATYSPVIGLADKTLCAFVASGANTSATPSFAPNGNTAHIMTKKGGVALLAGDIPAALAVCIVEYNLANTRWELLNPAKTNLQTDVSGILQPSHLPVGTVELTGGSQTTTAATAQNITDLVFAIDANSIYLVLGTISFGCNNTGGVKFTFSLPAGGTGALDLNGSAAAQQTPEITAVDNTGLSVVAFCRQNASGRNVMIMGRVKTVGTAGNFQMQFASATAGQTSTIGQNTQTALSFIKLQ